MHSETQKDRMDRIEKVRTGLERALYNLDKKKSNSMSTDEGEE